MKIKYSFASAAVLVLAVLTACRTSKPKAVYDIIIRGGRIIDGTGNPGCLSSAAPGRPLESSCVLAVSAFEFSLRLVSLVTPMTFVSRLFKGSYFQRNNWGPVLILIHVYGPCHQMEQQATPS